MFRSSLDERVNFVLRLVALFVSTLAALILVFLGLDSIPALRTIGLRLVTDPTWHPAATADGGTFGTIPMVAGTLLVTAGAIALAAPVGLASAVFCQFYAPPIIASGYRHLVEMLAGIPSVVFGFWGLVVLTPLLARWHPPGQSLLAGMLIVALMILPTIMLVIEASMAAVPRSYLQGAAALGLGRWAIVRNIVIPAARTGITTSVVLGAARAIGETMAVAMVCGNVVRFPRGLFDPVRTLTTNIALEMGYALEQHRSALFVSGLALLLICIALVCVVEWMHQRDSQQGVA